MTETLDKLLQTAHECWSKGCDLFADEIIRKYNVFITDQIKAKIKSNFGGGEISAQIANIILSCFFGYVIKCIQSLAILEAIENILPWKSKIPKNELPILEELQEYRNKMNEHKTEMERVMTELTVLFKIKDACDLTSSKPSQTEEEKITKLKKKFESESDYFEVEATAAMEALESFEKAVERKRQFVQWGLWGTYIFVGGVSLLAVGPALAAGTAAATTVCRICIPRWLAGSSLVAGVCISATLHVILHSYNSKLAATTKIKRELRMLKRDFQKLKADGRVLGVVDDDGINHECDYRQN